MTPHLDLKQQAIAAIDALHADESVSRSETRDTLADLSNHIDDLMRGIDAEEERLWPTRVGTEPHPR